MKGKNILLIGSVVVVALVSAVTILHTTPQVHAQDQQPPPVTDRISFGMVGITSGQTMRVSVTNLLPPGPSSELPPGPSRVVMAFRGMNGNLARNARTGEVIRKVVDLESGDSAFLDIDYDQLPPGPTRAQLRAVISVQYPEGTTMPSDIGEHKPFMPSVEVINNANGRTQFAVFTQPAVIRGFNPQPDPPIE